MELAAPDRVAADATPAREDLAGAGRVIREAVAAVVAVFDRAIEDVRCFLEGRELATPDLDLDLELAARRL